MQVRLKQLGQTPKHGMGQNFLLDGGVMMDIVAAADIQPGDRVLEVRRRPLRIRVHVPLWGQLYAW